MAESRITVTLRRGERAALMQLAQSELRTPQEQARYLIRCELERLGWLKSSSQQESPSEQTEVEQ